MEFIQKKELFYEQLEEIRREITKIASNTKELMTIEDLANYLSLSKSAIYKFTSKREIPFYNPGGKKIYFRKKEIDAWLDSKRMASYSETVDKVNSDLSNLKNSGL